MIADTQRKAHVDGFQQKLAGYWRWMFTAPLEAPSEDSQEWYAGLCVDPHSFTDQLARLQGTLRGGGNSRQMKPVESGKLRRG
jgi:hypothetical protein